MSNSYRIRTKPGVDSSIKVLIDQEFEYLEILSLKILQSQIYTRQCSDYGVIVGRVSVNNGFGIPNAKVSVFIPLDSIDENNPIVTDIYPYKSLTELNEDGYRYNLLPYKQQHPGHTPTGTFFTREDVLTNPTLIQVYDKYFKYTAVTNESGDYMIFGVPIGSQTIVVDVDLSDIGEFSLSPQDLIRMGMATEKQVSGTKFKSSTNLRELPQIINITRTIEVEPLWGQPEICNLGITRTDFDLSGEANVDITPTAIFMGSLISSNDGNFLKHKCKTKNKAGNLCEMVAGPGEILSIRQTIQKDIDGRPLLEQFDLEQGGQVIDDNGTWLIDVPMNLDYVITNEFGEQVISDDPKKGIPTKGRYRFKVKWNQSPSLSADPIKRGYFLVPNIKEYGWTINNGNRIDPLSITNFNTVTKNAAINSYAFSVDWNDYGDTGTTIGQQMIYEAINCEDRFYEFKYNKVYTVSQLITQYRKGYTNAKIIGIKDILDTQCESDVNKFPTNDGLLQFDIIYLLFNIMMFIFRPVIYIILFVVHILALLMWILYPILVFITTIIFFIVFLICQFINGIIWIINIFGDVEPLPCPNEEDYENMMERLKEARDAFTNIQIPVLSYPDCEFCPCEDGQTANSPNVQDLGFQDEYQTIEENGALSILSPFQVVSNYSITNNTPTYQSNNNVFEQLFSGTKKGDPNSSTYPLTPATRVPGIYTFSSDSNANPPYANAVFTNSLTLYERLNLFNTKAKYFEGVNQIKVSFNTGTTNHHYDNVIAIVTKPNSATTFLPGNLISFQNPQLSKDPNITGYTLGNIFGTNSITGTTFNNSGSGYTVNYTNPNNPSNTLSVNYISQQDPNDALYAKFPIDIEYFQVITGMTLSEYSTLTGNTLTNINESLPVRFLFNTMFFYKIEKTFNTTFGVWPIVSQSILPTPYVKPSDFYEEYLNQRIVFLVRGVDPNSTRSDCKYDLSPLFGKSFSDPNPIIVQSGVNGAPKYKLNIPIQGGYKNVQHNITNSNSTDSYSSGMSLYYESYHFKPETVQSNAGFTGFTSNLPSYYSRLDGTNMSFTPDGNGSNSLSFNSFTNSPQGVKVNSSNNLFVGEVSAYGAPPNVRTVNDNNTPSKNRGYFVNEIVEGGSAFFGTLPPNPNITWSPLTPVIPTNLYKLLYYAPSYSSATTINYVLGTNNNQIVMRSDRLPTSTAIDKNLENSFPLHSNGNFTAFYITDNGATIPSNGVGLSQAPVMSGATADSSDNGDEPKLVSSVINSFTCGSMVPLGCYSSSTNPSEIGIKPPTDGCYKDPVGGGKIFAHGGCYVFVSTPILSLVTDFLLLTEWVSRLIITFGACRNVFGHIFTNSWINGTLYAFSFRNDTIYSSPFSSNPNQAQYRWCRDVITLHPTYNYYYRSSPYNYIGPSGNFIGQNPPPPPLGGLFGQYGGNEFNLQFPTTLMDLGPRNYYMQELVMSDDYDGYVVNKLLNTTYSDVSELLNLFIITRLANTDFLSALISGNNILSYFSRPNSMIDGDYAQAISVNSELGVAPFESSNYPDNPSGQDPIYVNTLNSSWEKQVFGVFFSSDTRTRDFITPKRSIINPIGSINNPCTFSNFNVFTQEVPFYQWEIKPNDNNLNSIFGTQKNDWYTKPIYTNNNAFFKRGYQLMDRVNPNSRYFRTINTNQSEYFKGYIYSVDGSGNISASASTWNQNPDVSNAVTAGSPFYFYFGLKRGKSAFDRFTAKWIDTNKIVL